jgi:hypothetical protein
LPTAENEVRPAIFLLLPNWQALDLSLRPLPYSKVNALVSMVVSAKDCMRCSNGNATMPNNPNPLFSKAEWFRYCSHLTHLNLNHFKVVEAMGSKVIAVTSHAMASPPYKISSKSIKQIKSH